MGFGNPPAFMGFVGFVNIGTVRVRARSCDIRLSQDITSEDVVDGRIDRSVYRLHPKIVEGSTEFPAIMRDASGDPTATLWKLAAQRVGAGAFLNKTNIVVHYTNQFASFKYPNCIVNTFNFSVAQSDVVSISFDVIGFNREQELFTSDETKAPNSRIVTWNDAVLTLQLANSAKITGDYVRQFNSSLNNNAERFYTLNGKLEPQDIAAKKRDITGTMVLLGRHPDLGQYAVDNEQRCFEDSTILFGYELQNASCSGIFKVTLPNVVFRIEEISLTNELFETTVNWQAFPDISVFKQTATGEFTFGAL